MFPQEHKELLQITLHSVLGKESEIHSIKAEHGGSINDAYSFKYAGENFFLKHNSYKRFPDMFKKEAAGLSELAKSNKLVIPKVITDLVIHDDQYLILNHLSSIPEDGEFYETLGTGLASLHCITSDQFGFAEDNYIGSIAQLNSKRNSWSDFFYECRLEPLVRWMYDEKIISGLILKSFENLNKRLSEIFPEEKPALLHGDLWSGNKMNTTNGPAVFDPAVYYGHREMDIAMTRLFGGFGPEFYRAYNNHYTLDKDYVKRTDICNLYPLLVHVKLFGTSYLSDVLSTIKRF